MRLNSRERAIAEEDKMKLSTVSEMRAMDTTAIQRFGIPEELLRENGGNDCVPV